MTVLFKPERGFSWPETLTVHPKIAPIWTSYGAAGIDYLFYRNHPLSPFFGITDLVSRNEQVMEMLYESYGKKKGDRGWLPKDLSTDPNKQRAEIYQAAVDAFMLLSCSPDMRMIHDLSGNMDRYMAKIVELQQKVSIGALVTKDDKLLVDTISSLQRLYNETANQYREAVKYRDDSIAVKGMISIDELWNSL
jgi:hypothetical protein